MGFECVKRIFSRAPQPCDRTRDVCLRQSAENPERAVQDPERKGSGYQKRRFNCGVWKRKKKACPKNSRAGCQGGGYGYDPLRLCCRESMTGFGKNSTKKTANA